VARVVRLSVCLVTSGGLVAMMVQALLAYMPARNEEVENVTRMAIDGCVKLGYPLTVWHAGEAPTPGPLCEGLHAALGWTGRWRDYENGNLAENWLRIIDDGFGQGAEWVLWTSNDVIWNEKAKAKFDEIDKGGDKMTMYMVHPLAAFAIHRELWEKVRPFYDCDWPPSGYEDLNFQYTIVWLGGKLEHAPMNGLCEHRQALGVRLYKPQEFQQGKHHQHNEQNHDKFKKRWKIQGHSEWPPRVTEPEDTPKCEVPYGG
jgi:hypothetical protein